jgi:hypothetical protein
MKQRNTSTKLHDSTLKHNQLLRVDIIYDYNALAVKHSTMYQQKLQLEDKILVFATTCRRCGVFFFLVQFSTNTLFVYL